MCTSLTLKTKDGHNLLGRTMDFSINLNEGINLIPRNYKWSNALNNEEKKTKYALVGMSNIIEGHPVFADGVNEKGLTCATLYFAGFAHYEKECIPNKENLTPYDFVFWALSQFKDIEEVKSAIKNIEFVEHELDLLGGITPPLHWILSDKSSKSIVIERTNKGIEVFDNPVGVMTNSPNFEWHLTNLRQYTWMKAKQFEYSTLGDLESSPFSNGTGSFGLPGNFTAPARFVRATFLKNTILEPTTEIDGVTSIFHILANCAVPKGSVIKSNDLVSFTMYTSAMCSESSTYYYSTYENNQISSISLFNEDLDASSIKHFPIIKTQIINNQN